MNDGWTHGACGAQNIAPELKVCPHCGGKRGKDDVPKITSAGGPSTAEDADRNESEQDRKDEAREARQRSASSHAAAKPAASKTPKADSK